MIRWKVLGTRGFMKRAHIQGEAINVHQFRFKTLCNDVAIDPNAAQVIAKDDPLPTCAKCARVARKLEAAG